MADRWHLMENASAAFLMAVRRHMHAVRLALGQGSVGPTMLTAAERLQHEGWVRSIYGPRPLLVNAAA